MAPQKAVNPPATLPANFFENSGPADTLPGDFDFGDKKTSAAPKPQESGLESLGHAFGIGKEEYAEKQADVKQHPIQTVFKEAAGPAGQMAEGAYQGGKRIAGELGHAFSSLKEGNPVEAAVHGVQAIPFLGPAIEHGADQLNPGEKINPAEFGTALGASMQVAPMILGGLDTAMPGRTPLRLPSTTRAGKVFSSIRDQAEQSGTTVPLTNTEQPLQRFEDLTQAGGRRSKPFTQLYQRATDPTAPLSFGEGRDFYTNVTDAAHKTPLEKLMGRGMKPTMLRQAGSVKSGLNADLTAAADTLTPARGADYTDAMKEYANAKRIQKYTRAAALLGAGEAARRSGLLGNWIHRAALTGQ